MATNHNGKRRAADVVDLTRSDDETGQQPRKMARSENHPGTVVLSQGQRDQWVEEDGADDVIFLSQDGGMGGADEMLELYGVLQTKIVGVQYYTGYATIGEHVLIRREPGNQYDSNAIRVDSVQRDQIGHIPRQIAAKLAPFLDSGSLMVEGVLTGNKGQFDCPLAVSLYGTSAPADQEALKNQMKASGLPIDVLHKRQVAAKKGRAEELKKAAQEAKAAKKARKPRRRRRQKFRLVQIKGNLLAALRRACHPRV
jgi:SWI/SNF-related matrix-associated actin-dependent regulator of chromatin subfamily A3